MQTQHKINVTNLSSKMLVDSVQCADRSIAIRMHRYFMLKYKSGFDITHNFGFQRLA
jgi:hypothetical protein